MQGGETPSKGPTTITAGGTVTYDGTGGPYTLKNWAYSNLTINGGAAVVFNLPAATTTLLDCNITAGNLDANGYDLNVGRNWANTGTFTPGVKRVTLNTTNTAIVSGTTSFYDLTIDANAIGAAKTVNFASATTQTITNTITLNGAVGKILTLGLDGGTHGVSLWTLTLPGAYTSGDYITVADSDVTSPNKITPNAGGHVTDGGNNLGWLFSAPPPNAPTIDTPIVQSATSIRWVFTDHASDEDGFKVYDGSNNLKATCASPDLTYCDETGMSVNTLYNDRYVVAYSTANGNSAHSGTAAAIYTLANTPLAPTITVASSTSLTIVINVNSNPAGTEFAISCNSSDTTFLNYTTNACEAIASDSDHWRTYANWGGGSGFTDTGLTAGTPYGYKVKARNGDSIVTALSPESIMVAGGFVWDGGGGGDTNWSTGANWLGDSAPTSTDYVVFNVTSTNNSTVDAGFGGTIAGVYIGAGYTGTITAARSFTVTNDIILIQGTFDANDQTIGCANFTSTGSTTRALTMGSGTWTVTGNWDTSGSDQTINPETSTVDFTNSVSITTNVNMTSPFDFYKLHLAHNTKTVTMYTSATVGDEVTAYYGGTLNRDGGTAENTGLILYKSNGNPLVESGTGTPPIIGAAVIYQPTSGISVTGHNFTGSVYFRPDTASNIAFTLTSAITGSGTIYIYNKTDTNIATLDAAANNIQAASINIGSSVYTTAYGAFDAGSGAHTLSGNFGLTDPNVSTSNTLDMASSTISVGGSINFTGVTVTAGTSTVTMTATSGGKTITSASQSFNNLTFDGVSGGWTLQDDSVTAGNFTITNGTVSAGATTITDSGNFTVTSGTFTAGTSLVKLQGNGKTLAANGTVFNNLQLAGTGVGSSDTGWQLAGTGADNSGVGTYPWSTPENITADDSSYATATMYRNCADIVIKLIIGGGVTGNSATGAGALPATEATQGYGSASDKWGTTPSVSDINASNFGLAYAARDIPAAPDVWTHYLFATNFGFNIPAGSTIDGVEARIKRKSTGSGSVANVNTIWMKVSYTDGAPATITATDDFTVGGTLTTGSGDTLTINSAKTGTMNAGSTVTNGGTISGAGTLELKDDSGATATGGTLSSLVKFNTAAAGVTVPARTYGSNVEIYNNTSSNYSATLDTAGSQTITVTGSFTITKGSSGTITADANTYDPTINVGGSWINGGTFTAGTSSVTLNTATAAVVSGTTSFYDLTIDANAIGAAKTVNFASGTTQTVTHTIALNGSVGKVLTLGLDGGTHGVNLWTLTLPSDYTSGDYITVADSDVTSPYKITPSAGGHVTDGGHNPGWLFPGANNTPVNDSLTFSNPYSTNVAVADDTTEWNFEAKVTDADGSTDINYVMLRLANSSDSTTPYDSIRLKWTEATDTFSEDADTQNAITLTSTSANSSAVGNQWTLNFKVKIDNDFLTKDTNYAAEIYSIDDAVASDLDDYANKYQVTVLSLSLVIDDNTLTFGSLLPGNIWTGTSIATTTTNYPNGYSLYVQDNTVGTNSPLVHVDTTTFIADYVGTITTPTLWSGSGLGICVYAADTSKEAKWGTGTADNDANNKYAGVPQNSDIIHEKLSNPTSGDRTWVGYKLVVPNTQKTGDYTGTFGYSVTGKLN